MKLSLGTSTKHRTKNAGLARVIALMIGCVSAGIAREAAAQFGPHTDFPTGGSPSSVAIGDVNHDGKLDVATANSSSNTVSLLLGNGAGGLGAKTDFGTASSPRSVAIGNLSDDGNLDLAVAIGDVNGDHKPDLAVANGHANTVSVLLGDGTGGFGINTLFATGITPYSVAIRDLDGDTKPDLVTANFNTQTLTVLLGDGAGGFGSRADYVTAPICASVAIGDLNGDRRPDLVTANQNANNVSVLLNQYPRVAVEPTSAELPRTLELRAPSPNPTHGRTEFTFAVTEIARVRVDVYDVSGRRFVQLTDEIFAPGIHSVTWNCVQSSGTRMASGLLLVRVASGHQSATRKFVVVSP